jgi:hypothetical protein
MSVQEHGFGTVDYRFPYPRCGVTVCVYTAQGPTTHQTDLQTEFKNVREGDSDQCKTTLVHSMVHSHPPKFTLLNTQTGQAHEI